MFCHVAKLQTHCKEMLVSLGTVPKGKVSASYLSIAQKGIMLELLAHVYKFRSPMFGESLLSSLLPSSNCLSALPPLLSTPSWLYSPFGIEYILV